MDEAERIALAERTLAHAGSGGLEVMVSARHSALTRFTHNAIHQNVDASDATIRVRAVRGKQTGVATTNGTDADALRDVVARAQALAHFAPADDQTPELAGPQNYAPVETTAAATIGATERAAVARAMFDVAETNGYWAAGFVTNGTHGITLASTAGLRASYDATDSGANVKLNGPDATGFAEHHTFDARAIDGAALARRAAAKVAAGATPRALDPGTWTVILEPAAFGELIAYITDHFSAQSYEEGSSFLTGALGKPVFGTNVTIRDDYAHPLNPGQPFDFEGTPTQRIALVENGIAQSIVTDTRYARAMHCSNTGHALPAPNAYGPQPMNVVVEGGTKSTEQLIAETERGVLVTRLWYVRTIDQRATIVTGMTRDGTFLIENGRIVGGVRNMRFNQSIAEMLRDCELSLEQARTGSYAYSLVAPAAKIARFTFSSTTAF